MDYICNRGHTLHNPCQTIIWRKKRFFTDFPSTYTTLDNSKSPKIKCFGRLSTAFVIDIRRVRVPPAAVLSLLANDIEGRRSPVEQNVYLVDK